MNKHILAVVAPALFLAAHAYAQELEIVNRLKKEVAVRFNERPLAEVIQTLGEMVGVNTYLDPNGLRMEGVTTDIPVTINLTQPISLQSALNLILEPLRLSYVIENEVLRITSEQRGDSEIAEFRKRFEVIEQHSREIAARLNDSTSDPSEADALRKSLRESVQKAFVARQNLRRAELVEFKKRLDDLEQSLDERDRISEKIIDRRVEELLAPKLNWAPDEAGSDVKSANPEPSQSATAFENSHEKIEQVDAAVKQSVSDVDAGPVWGEAVDGLQLGVSGVHQDRRFKSGDTIRFRLQIRNVAAEAVRFEYKPPKVRDWVAPHVESVDGEQVEFRIGYVRGGHKHFSETLEPGAEASIHVDGVLVLGASDTAQKDWPVFETPEPGEYRLRGDFLSIPSMPTISQSSSATPMGCASQSTLA